MFMIFSLLIRQIQLSQQQINKVVATYMQQGNNVINNYKGVMLCSRPNQPNPHQTEKPFCARVVPPDSIGLVPFKKDTVVRQQKKNKNSILNRHKQWLEQFKQAQKKKKQEQEIKTLINQQNFKKIKEQAQNDRQRAKKMKQQYNQTATNVLNILDDKPQPKSKPIQLTSQNLKKFNEQNEQKASNENEQFKKKKKNKNQKPVWAHTQQQMENKEQAEVDELLNYFQTTEIKDFTEDDQVKQILKHLKQKIQKLRNEDNWKQKEVKKIKQKRQKANNEQKAPQDDKYSNFSIKSDGKSIASQKTQKKIQQLRDKLDKKNQGQQDWDKFTTSKQTATIQDKIAKNLADEVLRNYPHLRGVHSNTSIRKLIQAQAAKAILQPINRPVITTIVKQKIPLDTNNLPYLHRNPAI